mmetsp:Transcript_33837/g.59394  ORF Transcript_33837/g.59394 Transcript_33837/m.59394 type:complete len:781 (+) Transcript_33837:74-2416(+)
MMIRSVFSPSLAPFLNSIHLQLQLITQLVAIAVLLSASNNLVAAAKAGKASVSAFVSPPHVVGVVGASANFLRMSEHNSNNHENINQMDGYYCGQEIMEPLRMTTREEDSADVVRYQTHNDDDGTDDDDNFNDLNLKSNNEGQSNNNNPAANNMFQEKTEDDNGSEDNNPRRGRPGIVVFSGGTAFNSASAEMAARISVGKNNVGGKLNDGETISRSNSVSSLMDLMAMGSMETAMTNSNQGANNIAGGTKVWHVLPVTDDGGSTAEIVRVLGGPAVGDIRSRLLRLAPGTTQEARAVLRLLGHRLVSMQSLDKKVGDDNNEVTTHEMVSRMAREEWLDILDGGHESYQQSNNIDEDNNQQNYEHPLWKDVSAPYRSIIRSFLVHFQNQVLLTHNGIRQSQSNPPFDFTGGSVGNFFFAGARTFFGSLQATIFLFSKVAGIPSGSRVIPAVLSQERLVLGAVLKDGTRIRGQYQISHPHPKLPSVGQQDEPKPQSSALRSTNQRERSGSGSSISRHRQVVKSSLDSKEAIASLHPSPISTLHYLLHDPTWRRRNNAPVKHEASSSSATPEQQWSDRHEISNLEPNPLVLDAISNANCIVYGCGSLYTSVLPSLVLEGVGGAISERNVPKVLLLNGWHDSETSWAESSGSDDDGDRTLKRMDATSFVKAVVDALYHTGSDVHRGDDVNSDVGDSSPTPLVTDYITHILYPIGTEIEINEQSLAESCNSRRQQQRIELQVRGIESIPADTCSEGSRSGGLAHHRVFDPRALVDALLDLANGR